MKSPPRHFNLFAALLLGCAFVNAQAWAQQRATKERDATRRARNAANKKPDAVNKTRSQSNPNNGARAAQSQAARIRREAVRMLVETADAALGFDNDADKAHVQASVAEALWPYDETQARMLFRRAWEAADAADANEYRRAIEVAGAEALPDFYTHSREDVFLSAAARDTVFAETFLREMNESIAAQRKSRASNDAGGATATHPPDAQDNSSAFGRLSAAHSFLEQGDAKRAAAIAAPAVAEGATADFVRFLLQLRRAAPSEADALYLRLLARTKADAGERANTVLLLSAPVVSPQLLTLVREDGSISFTPVNYPSGSGTHVETASHVRRAFFDVAADVLRRPVPAAGDGAWRAEATARYFTIGRLLPFFEREAPNYVPELHARMNAHAADIEAARRESLAPQMETRSLSPRNPGDPLRVEVEAQSNAAGDDARDRAGLSAVRKASRLKLWQRARQFASDIRNEELKRVAQRIIAAHQVMSAGESFADEDAPDDFERAAAFAREADVPPEVRAAGLGQAAELAARKGKQSRAAELLDEAVGFAERSEQGTDARFNVFAMLTGIAARLGHARAWELLAATVVSANKLVARTGDAKETVHDAVSADERTGVFNAPVRLDHLFAAMARLDFTRALSEARSLDDVVERAIVIVAAVRATLEATGVEEKAAGRRRA